MRVLKTVILTASTLALGANAASAQEQFYGSAGIELSHLDINGDPIGGSEATNYKIGKLQLSMGREIGRSGYVQIDLRHSRTTNFGVSSDTYNAGTLGVLRAGTETGQRSWGGFLGAALTDQDDDSTSTSFRTIYGFEGALNLNSGLALSGQLGRIEGTGGSDGLDSIRGATFARVNMAYGLSDISSVSLDIAGAFGVMDTGNDDVSVAAVTLGYERILRDPNKKLHASVSRTIYNQYAEADVLGETQFSFGFNFKFGNSKKQPKTTRTGLAPVEEWIAQTGGPME